MNSVKYPITQKSMEEYAKIVFEPLSRDECVTTIWVPLAGRRRHSKFIIENQDRFKKYLPKHKTIFCYVDLINLTKEDQVGYLELITRTIFLEAQKLPNLKNLSKTSESLRQKSSNDYVHTLSNLQTLISEIYKRGHKTVLFLPEIDNLEWLDPHVFGNLRSLRETLYPALQYVFLIQNDLRSDEVTSNWGRLYQLLIQNVVHIPLLDSLDVTYMINRLSKEFVHTFSSSQISLIKEFGGNHPYLLKSSAKRVIDSDERNIYGEAEALVNDYSLESISMSIAEIISKEAIPILKKIAIEKDISPSEIHAIRDLIRRRVVLVSANRYVLFSRSFKNYIMNISPVEIKSTSAVIKLNRKTNQLFFLGKSVEENFTDQEFQVIRLFVEHYDRIITRDNIGTAMWGNKVEDKYSDWAIDQLMSKLRKKLTSIGVRNKLITVRGKGYKLKI